MILSILNLVSAVGSRYLFADEVELFVDFEILGSFYLFEDFVQLFFEHLVHDFEPLGCVLLEESLFLCLYEVEMPGKVGIVLVYGRIGMRMKVKLIAGRLFFGFLSVLSLRSLVIEGLRFGRRSSEVFIVFGAGLLWLFLELLLHVFLYLLLQTHVFFLLFSLQLLLSTTVFFHLHTQLFLVVGLLAGLTLSFLRIGDKQPSTEGLVASGRYF